MRRTSLVLVLAAACGGSPKPTTAPPPLEGSTEPATADTKPDPKEEEKAPPPKFEPPPGPIDLTIAAPKVAVKLVSAGKGKREAIKVTPKAGDQQAVELALDFSGTQTAPPEAPEQVRGKKEDVAPTIVLTGSAQVKSVDAAGTAYEVVVNGTDVRDAPGQQIPSELMKKALASLTALKIAGTVTSNGIASDLALHIDKGSEDAAGALALVRVEVLPAWPVLPIEPIGIGAKWQVTATSKLADKLDVTQTTDYELVKHEGKTWTIKGTTKVSGTDQSVDQAKLSNINGSGTVDVAMIDGALYPSMKAQVSTAFTATITKPPVGAGEHDPHPEIPASLQITYQLKQGSTVTPNPTPAATPAPAPTPAPAADPGRATPAPAPATPKLGQ
jgi:hypothetical protein